MNHLKALKMVALLCFPPHCIQHRIYQLSSLGVVTLGPIVACARHPKGKVIRVEEPADGASSGKVDGSRFQIGQHCPRCEPSLHGLVEVHISPLNLHVWVSLKGPILADSMFLGNGFPEGVANLVPALSRLDMYYLSHWLKTIKNKMYSKVILQKLLQFWKHSENHIQMLNCIIITKQFKKDSDSKSCWK